MRIGIVPNFDRAAGGTFQYAVTLVRAMQEVRDKDEVFLFLYAGESLPEELAGLRFPIETLRTMPGRMGAAWTSVSRALPPRLRTWLRATLGSVFAGGDRAAKGRRDVPMRGEVDPLWRRFFAEHGIELLVFTNENDLAFRSGVPYVVAIHDLQHRLNPEFEEVSGGAEAERREYRIGNNVRGATLILVDSEVGREDMTTLYGPEGVDADAAFVLPFLPADYLGATVSPDDRESARAKYGLPERYLFYPAQFAPSKNHVRIVEALGRLAREGTPIDLVLTGTHSGALREATFSEVMKTADGCGVADSIHYLGYVDDEVMPALFAEATGMIMPTFFGPTNIPVLEAWSHDCPVITSDIRGIRDQVGDAAILVDPTSVDSIADGIRRLILDPHLGEELARRGREALSSYDRHDYLARLSMAIGKAKSRMAADAAARSGTQHDSEELT
jgi:glycosyltransferase involved in cell wall biosynthesis